MKQPVPLEGIVVYRKTKLSHDSAHFPGSTFISNEQNNTDTFQVRFLDYFASEGHLESSTDTDGISLSR